MQIEPEFTASDSGLYFQQAHPLVTLNNIAAVMPPDWDYRYTDWDVLNSYQAGDKVAFMGTVYVATDDNSGQQPDTGADWKEFNPVTDYLEYLTRTGITKAVQDFIRTKQLNHESRNIFEYRQLFHGLGRKTATTTKSGNFVGFQINHVKSMGVSMQINRVGFQMIGDAGPVKLYLFHTNSYLPVKEWTFNLSANGGYFQWFDLPDAFLDWRGGGRWFLCYDQDQIPLLMDAININRDWSADPCHTCTGEDLGAWRELNTYCNFMPFRAKKPGGFADFNEDFFRALLDPANIVYTHTENYGLNLQIAVGCDLTDFIIQQRFIFKDVIQLMVGNVALRTMIHNPDVNVSRNTLNVSHLEVTYELDGSKDTSRNNSIGEQLDLALKAVELDTRGLDPLCLKCKKSGIRFKSV